MNPTRSCQSCRAVGSDPFTVTVTTPSSQSAPLSSSSPVVTLLLGAALGAGLVTLIFTWK